MSEKLNRLLADTPPGAVLVQPWLSRRGISPSLVRRYVASGWLTKLARGAYARVGREPTWSDALCALQQQLDKPVHLAGLTSLEQQGLAHYLRPDALRPWLAAPPDVYLPAWFEPFAARCLLVRSPPLPPPLRNECLVNLTLDGTQVAASGPELAALEVAAAVPGGVSFEHAADLFGNLSNLRPRRVQALLAANDRVGVNRVFLFLAWRAGHTWFDRLREEEIDLGRGTRQVVQGGRVEPRYRITVPAAMVGDVG